MSFGWVATNLVQYPNVSVLTSLTAGGINVQDLTINGTINGTFAFGDITADSLTVLSLLDVPNEAVINSLVVTNLTASVSSIKTLTVLDRLQVTGVAGDQLNVSTAYYPVPGLGTFTALTVDGYGLVAPNLLATSELLAGSSALGLPGYLNVNGSALVQGSIYATGLRISSLASFGSVVNVNKDLFVQELVTAGTVSANDLFANNQARFFGGMNVTGVSTFLDTVITSGVVSINSDLTVSNGVVFFASDLSVSGTTTVEDLTINGTLSVNGGTLSIDNLTVKTNLTVSGVTNLEGAVAMGQGLMVTGSVIATEGLVGGNGYLTTFTNLSDIDIGTYTEVDNNHLIVQNSFSIFNNAGDRFLTFYLNDSAGFLTVYYNAVSGGAVQSYNLIPLVSN
jgi:hypothetical protein